MKKTDIDFLRNSVHTFIEDCKYDLSTSDIEDPRAKELIEQIARHTTTVFDDIIKVLSNE